MRNIKKIMIALAATISAILFCAEAPIEVLPVQLAAGGILLAAFTLWKKGVENVA